MHPMLAVEIMHARRRDLEREAERERLVGQARRSRRHSRGRWPRLAGVARLWGTNTRPAGAQELA